MKGEIVLLIISAVIFVSYTQFITFKYGIQKSISESYYDLPRNWQFIFTLTLWGFAFPVIIAANTALLFLAGGLICLVGAAPAFKKQAMEYKAHMIGAYGGIILGFSSLVYDYKLYSLVLISVVAMIILRFSVRHYIWWVEVTAFITILLGILMYTS